ncbi:MAG: hypothetical protein ACK4M7_02520 [Burkholderiales bacterium]
MTITTIKRAFANPTNILTEAKKCQNPLAFYLKNLLYQLVTFGLSKSLHQARSQRREEEAAKVVCDIYSNLCQKDLGLKLHNSTLKYLYPPGAVPLSINIENGYTISQIGKKIFMHQHKQAAFNPSLLSYDRNSVVELLDLKGHETNFMNEVVKIVNTPYWEKYTLSRIDRPNLALRKLEQMIFEGRKLLAKLDIITVQFAQQRIELFKEFIQKEAIPFTALKQLEKNITEELDEFGRDEYLPLLEFFLFQNPNLKAELKVLGLNQVDIVEPIIDLIPRQDYSKRNGILNLATALTAQAVVIENA